MTNKSPYFETMERAVLRAARVIIEGIEEPTELKAVLKPDMSIVTELDLAAQQEILSELGKMLPVVAEEDEESHAIFKSASDMFLVDPLDGTTACRHFMALKGGQVGFGPMVGWISGGELMAAAYYNVPTRTLISAVRGQGAHAISREPGEATHLPELGRRHRLSLASTPPLSESSLLFYTSPEGELRVLEDLRRNHMIETAYRFGGFANDCTRLALGYEHILLQFKVKAWDLPALLFAHEVGLAIILDPAGTCAEFTTWKIQANNPVLIAPREHLAALFEVIRKVLNK